MQQNKLLHSDENLSSHDGIFDVIIEGKKRSTSSMLSDGVNQQMEKIVY